MRKYQLKRRAERQAETRRRIVEAAAALADLYGYYRRTESMMENLLRDMRSMPLVAQHLEGYFQFLDVAQDILAAGRSGGRRLQAALRLALHFRTWQTLAREAGLDDGDAVDLMARAVLCAAPEGKAP